MNVLDALQRFASSRLSQRERYECPVCGYEGMFRDYTPGTGHRRAAQCPGCGALERHRLQALVFERVMAGRNARSLLHFAPEAFFAGKFRARFPAYVTADIDRRDVDCRADLERLPFADASFDVVYASHVLEHVRADHAAIPELRRILAPGGIAFLPVPIVCETTVEYPAPNPHEAMHVRAPGIDYFDRLRAVFERVEVFESRDFPARHQTFVLEDRSGYPNETAPFRTPMAGTSHADYVPVCHAC